MCLFWSPQSEAPLMMKQIVAMVVLTVPAEVASPLRYSDTWHCAECTASLCALPLYSLEALQIWMTDLEYQIMDNPLRVAARRFHYFQVLIQVICGDMHVLD